MLSAYLRDTPLESVEKLHRLVEILNRPFGKQELIDAIEDKSIYAKLQNMDIETDLRHEQLKDALDLLKRVKNKGEKSRKYKVPISQISSNTQLTNEGVKQQTDSI